MFNIMLTFFDLHDFVNTLRKVGTGTAPTLEASRNSGL